MTQTKYLVLAHYNLTWEQKSLDLIVSKDEGPSFDIDDYC